jgi:hypothetical protein
VPNQSDQSAAGGGNTERRDGRVEKAARNQVLFREVNERIASLTGRVNETGVNLFVCECSDPGCAEAVEVTSKEYEAVRAHGSRFVIVDGHQMPEIERVVDGNGRFLVVEKIGAAGEIAAAGNMRAAGSWA